MVFFVSANGATHFFAFSGVAQAALTKFGTNIPINFLICYNFFIQEKQNQ